MAVVRPEMMTREVEWLLELAETYGDATNEMHKKCVNNLRREFKKGLELDEWDRKKKAKVQRMLQTGADEVCPSCSFAPPRHAKGCAELVKS